MSGAVEPEAPFMGERRDADDRVLYPEDPGYDTHMRDERPERFWAFPGRR